MKRWGRLIIIILPLIFISNKITRAEAVKSEAIFSVKYLNFSEDYLVYQVGDSLFAPLEEVMAFLRIYYIAKEGYKYEGYVNNQDSSFTIDINGDTYESINGKKGKIGKNRWISDGLQIYARVDFIEELFCVSIGTFFNSLTLNIKSKYDLPVKRFSQISFLSSSSSETSAEEESFGPLLSDNSFSFLNGGVLDYRLSSSFSDKRQNYGFYGNLGLLLLGGEFQYNISSSYAESIFQKQNDNIRWRYQIGSDYLYAVSLGNLFEQGGRSINSRGYRKPFHNLRGIQITNENFDVPPVFSQYVIEDKIEPNWTIELYLNNNLYNVQKSDLTGYYKFEIPIKYGLSNISMKLYGPKGEYYENDIVLNVPNMLLQPGEIRYTVSAGEDINSKVKMLSGSFYAGITDWFTSSISAYKAEATPDYTLVSQSALNLFRYILLNFTITNKGIYDAALQLPNSSIGNFSLSYTTYDKSFIDNRSESDAVMYLMYTKSKLFSLPVSLNISADHNFNRISSSNVNTSLSFYGYGFSCNLRHFMSGKNYLTEGLSQSLSFMTSYSFQNKKGMSFMNGTHISLISSMNINNKSIEDVSLNLSRSLFKDIYISASTTYNVKTKRSNYQLSLNMNLPYVRNTTSASYNSGSYNVNSSLNGSVEFDSFNKKFSLGSSSGSGVSSKSSATVKFYIDENNNKKYDKNESLIEGAEVSITNSSSTRENKKGFINITGLKPSKKYNVKLKEESLGNPSIIPDYKEFSFVSQPYTYTNIEIPCYIGGILEGSIKKEDSLGRQSGQAGVRIQYESHDGKYKDSKLVFSDGSFNAMGVPVGKYKAYVDSSQLKILKAVSFPAYIEFEVKPTADGDYISNINFILRDDKESYGLKGERLTAERDAEKEYDVSNVKERIEFYYSDKSNPELTPEIREYMNSLAAYLKLNPAAKILVEAHADKANASAQALTDERARHACDYLISLGIDKLRMVCRAEGGNYSAGEGKPSDRIEIVIIK